jgi:hypothetical protein
MRPRLLFFAVLAAYLAVWAGSAWGAVNTEEIDKVRSKGILEEKDFAAIDAFVKESVEALVQTQDFTSIAKIRTVILARANSEKDSAAAQYAEQFSESAYKHLSEALKAVETTASGKNSPPLRQVNVTINLLILIDGLADVRLAELAAKKLGDERAVVRYWAVHCLTNPVLIERIKAGGDSGQLSKIAGELGGVVAGAEPETLGLMVRFATSAGEAKAKDLMLKIADERIKSYAEWKVKYELLDAAVLKMLEEKLSSSPTPASQEAAGEIARRFAQLYSYAIQRLAKGKDILSEEQKGQLSSVLADIEATSISKIMGAPQSNIKKALEGGDYSALMEEHNKLLGDEKQAGQLALKLNFNYGTAADGSGRTAPDVLPEPPPTGQAPATAGKDTEAATTE